MGTKKNEILLINWINFDCNTSASTEYYLKRHFVHLFRMICKYKLIENRNHLVINASGQDAG